jgi:Na+-driven multidrug efflux pump
MGTVWEVFEATTAGLGEAGGTRVTFYLEENQPEQAKIVADKAVFLATIQALTISSIFLLLGPNISVAFTDDNTLQNLINGLVGLTALANVSMTFSQVYWSLVGAQGQFALASVTFLFCRLFIIYPLAATCAFAYAFNLNSIAACIAIGYASASFALAYVLLKSDWRRIASDMAYEEDIHEATEEGHGEREMLSPYLDDAVIEPSSDFELVEGR